MGVIRTKFSSLSTDSEPMCLAVSVDRIQLLVRAVLFMGAIGLTRRSDFFASIWHPLLRRRDCILLVDGQDVRRDACCGICHVARGTYCSPVLGGDGVP